MTRLEELKFKRKATIIGVCTLGLAALTIVGVGKTWQENVFKETSLAKVDGLGFILRIISFLFLSFLVAIPFFFISLIKLIYYQIKISKLT